MARVDSLPDESKRLLQTISVVGREFNYNLIKRITDLTERELLAQISTLKESELLYERGIYPQSTYIFKHALTQEVTYNSILLKRRKEIHEKIGKAIEALNLVRLEEHYELLAHHYRLSGNTDKAVSYLELSNKKALKALALVEAKVYFEEVFELLKTLPKTEKNQQRLISLVLTQDLIFRRLFKFKEYYELLTSFESMAVSLGNPSLMGTFYCRMGVCEHHFGNADQTIQTLTKASELCESTGNANDAAQAYGTLVWAHLLKGEYDKAFALKKDILRVTEQKFNPTWLVQGLSGASFAYACLGRWDEALEDGKKALKVADEYSDNDLISYTSSYLTVICAHKRDLDQAIKYGELALQKAPTPYMKALAQRVIGLALCRAGESKRGIDFLEAALSIHKTALRTNITTKCYLGEGYWLAGEVVKARQMLEDVLEIMNPSERGGMMFGFAHRLLGEIALKQNPVKAIHHFEKSIAVFKEIKAENELALAFAGYGRFYKEQGQNDSAREYLSMSLEIFERLGTLIEPDKVREELKGLPGV
jgi:tetratricopeptide (TPR) repeat protein